MNQRRLKKADSLSTASFIINKKFGHTAQKRIIKYLKEKIRPAKDPRLFGKPLSGDLNGVWSYRVGDYRILATIEDENFILI